MKLHCTDAYYEQIARNLLKILAPSNGDLVKDAFHQIKLLTPAEYDLVITKAYDLLFNQDHEIIH